MVKEKKSAAFRKIKFSSVAYFVVGIFLASIFLLAFLIFQFERSYSQKIYPGVRVDGISFDGKKPEEIEKYFTQKSLPFAEIKFTFNFEDKISTISGEELAISYDSKLSAAQAYSIGRSDLLLSDTYQKWRAATVGINLPSVLKINTDLLEETLDRLATTIDYPSQDALFQFEKGKVTLFRIAKSGRTMDKTMTKQMVYSYINSAASEDNLSLKEFTVNLPVVEIHPKIKTAILR